MTTLLEGDFVARTVIEGLELDTTPKEFHKRLKVEVLPDTSVLKVTYDTTDPEIALDVLTQVQRVFDRRVRGTLGVRGDATGSTPPGGSFDLIVRVFDPPHIQADTVSPSRSATLILAGIVGLVLGMLLAVARDSLDFRIQGSRDAEEWFGAPVVGALPKPRGRTPIAVGDERHSASLDLLRARLQFTPSGIGGPTILVTSAAPDEGKSTVAASLAAALARAGKRVVLIDADLRRPTVHGFVGLDPDGPGLTDVLQGRIDVEEALWGVRFDQLPAGGNGAGPDDYESGRRAESSGRLEVLPAGRSSAALGGVLTPDALTAMMDRLHERADYIIFDAPPLIVADAFGLALAADNVLLVARNRRTTRDQAEWSRATLEGLGVERVSVVLTNAPPVETYA
jgi:Mrp family chromosome partitioning ATPase/capsular polysaccharide biosynthesis protein